MTSLGTSSKTADWDLEWMSRHGSDLEHLRPKGLGHVILAAIVLFFTVFLVWANWATLEEVTRGEGRVIPSRQIQVVQNLEGGIVSELLVREGEIVEEGQPLMRIDNSRAESDYLERRARYLALLASASRLEAEINESAIEFPLEVLSEDRGLAEREMRLFEARQEQLEDELEIQRRQAEQREQELAELKTRLGQYARSYSLASEELKMTEPLAQRRVVAQSDFLKLQRQVNDLQGEYEQTKLAVPRAEAALREAQLRIEGVYSKFRQEALRELTAVQAEISGLREIVSAGEDRVRRTEVQSPVRGTIKQLNFNTIGGVIQPGEDLVEIVPLEDTLLVEAQVRPADIAFLAPGLPATVKITAYDFSIYGGLDGKVENISADTITNEQGESFYRVRVRTEENALGTEDEPLAIIPGMTAQVDVLTGEKTVMDYLLKPILKAREVALRER
jgi:adhesin transport system membrane fusion protein